MSLTNHEFVLLHRTGSTTKAKTPPKPSTWLNLKKSASLRVSSSSDTSTNRKKEGKPRELRRKPSLPRRGRETKPPGRLGKKPRRRRTKEIRR